MFSEILDFLGRIPGISSVKLFTELKSGRKITIVDVREEWEYKQGHIPGAILIPQSGLKKADKEVLNRLKAIDRNNMVVVYCAKGVRSRGLAKILKKKGYKVYNLDGIAFWKRKGLPLER